MRRRRGRGLQCNLAGGIVCAVEAVTTAVAQRTATLLHRTHASEWTSPNLCALQKPTLEAGPTPHLPPHPPHPRAGGRNLVVTSGNEGASGGRTWLREMHTRSPGPPEAVRPGAAAQWPVRHCAGSWQGAPSASNARHTPAACVRRSCHGLAHAPPVMLTREHGVEEKGVVSVPRMWGFVLPVLSVGQDIQESH